MQVVVIDGPPAAGKTTLAVQLAEELDMRHFPEATMDDIYIDSYGFDLRSVDHEMPASCRTFDHKDFCRDPGHVQAANFQIMMFRARCSQYIDAMTHLLNTGQGVVLERSPWSDFVFVEAMYKCGFIKLNCRNAYRKIKANIIKELRRPQLVIYLDVPVSETQERIKARKLEHEQNSPAFSNLYLDTLERQHKQTYLKEMGFHAEVMVYDWSVPGDTEGMVEDIERLDFDNYPKYGEMGKDWRFFLEQEMGDARAEVTNYKPEIMNFLNVPVFDVPELLISAEDTFVRNAVMAKIPSNQYVAGYNKALGDRGLLFKTDNKATLRTGIDPWA